VHLTVLPYSTREKVQDKAVLRIAKRLTFLETWPKEDAKSDLEANAAHLYTKYKLKETLAKETKGKRAYRRESGIYFVFPT